MEGTITFKDGDFKTFLNGKLHSFGKQPAVINKYGSKEWYQYDKRHNDDRDSLGKLLPAVINKDGSKFWYQNGKRHNDDRDSLGKRLPACVIKDGSMYWYQNSKCHNDDRDSDGKLLPACVIKDGSKEYYLNGERINENDPRMSEDSSSDSKHHDIIQQLTANLQDLQDLPKEKLEQVRKFIEFIKNA